MIINMSASATAEQISHVVERIQECGYQAHLIQGAERTVIGAVGNNGRRAEIEALRAAPGVQDVIQIAHPFKLVSRQLQQRRTIVDVGGVKIGAGNVTVMAGPRSVESGGQVVEKAAAGKSAAAKLPRRGGAQNPDPPHPIPGAVAVAPAAF